MSNTSHRVVVGEILCCICCHCKTMVKCCCSFGVLALCSLAQAERERRACLGCKITHGKRTQMLPDRELMWHLCRSGACRFRLLHAETTGKQLWLTTERSPHPAGLQGLWGATGRPACCSHPVGSGPCGATAAVGMEQQGLQSYWAADIQVNTPAWHSSK